MISDRANLIIVRGDYSNPPVSCCTVSTDFLTALWKWTRRPPLQHCPSHSQLQFLLRIILSLQITLPYVLLPPNTLWVTWVKLQLTFFSQNNPFWQYFRSLLNRLLVDTNTLTHQHTQAPTIHTYMHEMFRGCPGNLKIQGVASVFMSFPWCAFDP